MKRILLVALAALGLSCGGDDSMLKGEFCDRMGDVFCQRANACAIESYNACFQGFKGACCASNGSCQSEVANGQGIVDRCTAAMPSHSCNELRQGIVPPACLMN